MLYDILISQKLYDYIDKELPIGEDNTCNIPNLGKVKLHVVPTALESTIKVPCKKDNEKFYEVVNKRYRRL